MKGGKWKASLYEELQNEKKKIEINYIVLFLLSNISYYLTSLNYKPSRLVY